MNAEKLKNILKGLDEVGDMEIRMEHSLTGDLHLTSFSFMVLLMELEEQLHCELEPDIFFGVDTVQDLYEKLLPLF